MRTNEVVGAIIEHAQHGFLLQYRGAGALFGGAVEQGEAPKEALWRELAEEITFAPDMACACTLVQRNVQQNGTIQYIYHIQTRADLNELTLLEGEDIAYVDAETLFARPFAFNSADVLRCYVRQSHG